ncbi:MAG: 4Fe-4S cluster-binding domain-containing protein [Bacteroidetes bacterium]|nr:4Fe-4S cluster-binding domain-containing protein [Bacteroidota bacterium]MBM3424855.1 4Fe-4S cluster-binding domain-containing protein [Bacteroidota bacterium]
MQQACYQIMEHFSTLQGEGYHSGRSAYFLRLSGCDIACVWCDVKESWSAVVGESYSLERIQELTENHNFVVLTGGEPAMHNLYPLTQLLHRHEKYVSIETSGCYPLKGSVDWYTFSPKKFKEPCEEAYTLANELKVVIYHLSDLEWAKNHSEKVSDSCLLYLQPEWSKRAFLQEGIISFIHRNPRWKLSLQTHKYLEIP